MMNRTTNPTAGVSDRIIRTEETGLEAVRLLDVLDLPLYGKSELTSSGHPCAVFVSAVDRDAVECLEPEQTSDATATDPRLVVAVQGLE